MSKPAVVTGAQRRRYEGRRRPTDATQASVAAIERAISDCGGTALCITWEGANVVLVTARTPDGSITGGRAALPEHDGAPIAIMYAGAVCIRGLIESRPA